MTRLLYIILIAFLIAKPVSTNAIEGFSLTEEQIQKTLMASYWIGYQDAGFKQDDIGLVRLSIEDIHDKLK